MGKGGGGWQSKQMSCFSHPQKRAEEEEEGAQMTFFSPPLPLSSRVPKLVGIIIAGPLLWVGIELGRTITIGFACAAQEVRL